MKKFKNKWSEFFWQGKINILFEKLNTCLKLNIKKLRKRKKKIYSKLLRRNLTSEKQMSSSIRQKWKSLEVNMYVYMSICEYIYIYVFEYTHIYCIYVKNFLNHIIIVLNWISDL